MMWRSLLVLLALCCLVAGEIEVSLDADGSVAERESLAADREPQRSDKKPLEEMTEQKSTKPEHSQLENNEIPGALVALQEELAMVDQMVQLQEKKLQVLQKIRTKMMEKLEAKEVAGEEEVFPRQRPPVDFADLIERKIDQAISNTELTRTFDNYFVERASIPLLDVVADVKMAKITPNSDQEFIAVAYSNGKITFFISPTTEVRTIFTDHGIKNIALSSQDDQVSLVVSYEAPTLGLFSLNLTEENATPKTGHTLSLWPKYSVSIHEQTEIKLTSPVAAATIARAPRQNIAVVAQVDGVVNFFSLNGTSLRQLHTNASIAAMETRRNLLAFNNGTALVLSSMTRTQGSEFYICPGSSVDISSIAFDTVHQDLIYAGTQRGDVLVYAMNLGGAQPCQLVSRAKVNIGDRNLGPAVLATTRKYIIAAGPQNIAVFNVSKASHVEVTLEQLCDSRITKSKQASPAMTFSEGPMGSHLAFVATDFDGQNSLVLFHSLLPVEREASEFQWTIFLYAAIVIASVVGTQLYVRCQKRSNVNPWDSIGKTRQSPYGKYGGLNNERRGAPDLPEDNFERYESLSDDLRRKIAQAKKETTHYPIDKPAYDYDY